MELREKIKAILLEPVKAGVSDLGNIDFDLWASYVQRAFLDSPEWFKEHGYIRVETGEGELAQNKYRHSCKSPYRTQIHDMCHACIWEEAQAHLKAQGYVKLPDVNELSNMLRIVGNEGGYGYRAEKLLKLLGHPRSECQKPDWKKILSDNIIVSHTWASALQVIEAQCRKCRA